MATKQPAKLSKTVKDTAPDALVQASTRYTVTNQNKGAEKDFLPPLETPSPEVPISDMILSELHTARLLNVEMPDEPKQFIRILESRIQEITGTRRNVILILDEDSGTYSCLNDEQHDSLVQSPREITWVSDTYLQDLLGSEHVIHSFLHHQGNIFGIVAIAEKVDGSDFTLRDEIVLEQLTQYLSVQVNHFLTLKRSMVLPNIQRILLQISNRLLSAVDSTAIFQNALHSLCQELPFSAGQYIELDKKTGKGQIFYQLSDNTFQIGSATRKVEHFASLLSLFRSQVWKHAYLYLKGEMLGDKTFAEIFGIPDVVSVLVLPIVAPNNELKGALVLFQQKHQESLSKDALKVLEQVSELVISACSRAQILEKALEIATTDELTGAVNRRGFYSRFDAEVERGRRNQTPICLAIIDIDHFKSINDTYGHLAGDIILKQFAKQVMKNIRKSDILCRFGGEEFCLALPETSLQAGAELVERLRKKIDKMTFQTQVGSIKVTFSAGIDVVETTQGLAKDSMQVISESLARADEALYEAKQLGRNRVVLSGE